MRKITEQIFIQIPRLMLIILPLALSIMSMGVEARAGGGGSSGGGWSSGGGSSMSGEGGGSLIGAVIAAVFFFFSWVGTTFALIRKNIKTKILVSRLKSNDSIWDPKFIKPRVGEIYFAVQKAWMERDQDLAKEYMSKRLYNKHKSQTDAMIKKHEKNILENIRLYGIKIIEVEDYLNDSNDNLWIEIMGAIKDYTIDDRSEVELKSVADENFTELWRLVRHDDNWVLDEIDSEVDKNDYLSMNSISEELNAR